MARDIKTSVRLHEETERQLKQLAEWLGISQASVIEMAIRKLYARESPDHEKKNPSTPLSR